MLKNIRGIEVEIIRKKVKNINLAVLPPDGHVRVSVPVALSEERIEEFIAGKAEWIRLHQERVIKRAAQRESDSKLNAPELTDQERKQILAEYREILAPKIERYIKVWEERTGLYSSAWQLRDMKTRWGSCSPRSGKIRFSLRLAEKPDECIEYVVLHELAHLKVPNHGADFKALLSRYMPDWRERQKRLQTGK